MFVRADDKIIRVRDNEILYKTTKDISHGDWKCPRKLPKGSIVRKGEEWFNYYGRWIRLYDEKDTCYDVEPYEIKNGLLQEMPKAETIEKLCDRFVLVGAGLYRTVNFEIDDLIDNESPCYNSLEEILHSGHIVYGAIWTNKGLIYVAKMNDKGELELLC